LNRAADQVAMTHHASLGFKGQGATDAGLKTRGT